MSAGSGSMKTLPSRREARPLNRRPPQIRTVLQAFKNSLFTELFPGRILVPKTLIVAKDDSHAEDIVHLVREVFGPGNDFAKKITYKAWTRDEALRKERALVDYLQPLGFRLLTTSGHCPT